MEIENECGGSRGSGSQDGLEAKLREGDMEWPASPG